MLEVRKPAVAGTFYPADPEALRAQVERCLADARPAAPVTPKALVVPHAGYIYSGPVAGSAYALAGGLRERIHRVVLLGPSHRVGFRGIAVPECEAFETPLGRIPLDAAGVARARALPQVVALDAAHAREHSLEVQLPFLQLALGDFSLVPLSVGDATPEEVEAVIEALWGGDETLVVVSSDLSHYLPYDAARALDRRTTEAIERLAPEAIGREQACGRLPVQGLLRAARRHGLHAHTLDVRSSGDTAGSRDSVVGYGAWAFSAEPAGRRAGAEAPVPRTPPEAPDRAASPDRLRALRPLLAIARASVEHGLRTGTPFPVDLSRCAPLLRAPGASFVTLHVFGALRGCTGSLVPTMPLALDVSRNAHRAAFGDPRFAPLGEFDLGGLHIHVSVLGPIEPLAVTSEDELVRGLRPGVDGLVLEDGPHRATFLPAVWRQLPDPRAFVHALQRKAGLPEGHWSPATRAFRYGVLDVEDGGA